MTSKLQIYDIFCALVPGVLLLCILTIGFPELAAGVASPNLPDSFAFLALTVLAVFTGHIVQTLVSLLEPLLYKSWGSQPSDLALTVGLGDRYFPKDSAERISAKLKAVVGVTASNRSLFFYAMTLAESVKSSRTASFNASYAYHRALLMLTIASIALTLISAVYGALHAATRGQVVSLLALELALTVMQWYRCKQRAFYYVREVLMTAERLLDSRSAPSTHKD